MYKYVRQGGKGESPSQRRNNRIRSAVTLVLLAALVGVAIYSTGAIMYRSEARDMIINRMQSECSMALTLTNSLSRTAGSSSSATLGKIRGHVYTMETLEAMYDTLHHISYVPEDTFSALYALIDDYSNKLITGMNTGEMQSSLMVQLQSLQQLVVDIR